MSEEEIKSKLLDIYKAVLKKYRIAVAGRACTSTRDFLHGEVTQTRVIIMELYGSAAPGMLRTVEGD